MDLSAIFCLDRKREKRYHKPQVNHYCDEEEEYLRSICRELSVGVRQRCETEKGTLEQCHKRGLMRRHQSTRVEPRKILRAFVPCRRGKGRELFLRKTMSHAEAVMCLHIGQHLFGECIDMSNGACVRELRMGRMRELRRSGAAGFTITFVLRSINKLFCKEEFKWQ